MGAVKKWQEEKEVTTPFQVIEGGKSEEQELSPADDFFIFHAFEDVKFFFQFLPYHLSNWSYGSGRQVEELNRQKEQNYDDFRYYNFF